MAIKTIFETAERIFSIFQNLLFKLRSVPLSVQSFTFYKNKCCLNLKIDIYTQIPFVQKIVHLILLHVSLLRTPNMYVFLFFFKTTFVKVENKFISEQSYERKNTVVVERNQLSQLSILILILLYGKLNVINANANIIIFLRLLMWRA